MPLLTRLRLSFSKAFSVLHSSMVISGFIDIEEFNKLLLVRTWEAPMTLRNLTRTGRGRVLVCLNCPSLWRFLLMPKKRLSHWQTVYSEYYKVMFLAVSSGGVSWRLVNFIEDYIIASVRHIIWWFGWSDRYCCVDWNLFNTGRSQVYWILLSLQMC